MPDRFVVAKFRILREIFDLAREQRAHLEADRLDLVVEVMDRRDDLVRELDDLADEAAAIPSNVVPFPALRTNDWSQQDRLALDTLIRGIMEHDQQNEQILAEKMDAILLELPRLQHARRAAAGYQVTRYGSNYVDRVS